MTLNTYHSLPGVEGGQLEGPMAKSLTGILDALKEHRICSAAGDHGAVTVYRDDTRNWRCFFHVWQAERDAQVYTTKTEVRAWLKKWLPAMRHTAEHG